MAYTYDQLVQAYTAAHDGVGPDAATKANFQVQAVQSANGQQTDAQLLSNIVNSADNSTGLAVMAYQFFTGKSPTKAGIDYLVNSPTNNNDLNDAYYAKFGLENRYINFAGNLGVQGEGAANFSAKYGALSFADYVASIYQTIIGASYATAAGIDPAKAIADIISRKDAILATAQGAGMIPPNATQAQIDIALKAATAGYLLGEAIKADVGLYAAATDNFMVAVAQGTATYNTDITLSYQPGVNTPAHGTGHTLDNAPPTLPNPASTTQPNQPAGPNVVAQAFTLTAGADTFTGGALGDTFTGTDTTFNAGDVLNGGAGADTLTITGGVFGTYASPSFSNVSNIETINISNFLGINTDVSAATGVQTLNVTSSGALSTPAAVKASGTTNISLTVNSQSTSPATVDGGKDVTVVSTGNTGGAIAIGNTTAPTGAITVNATTAGATTGGSITVIGGTTVDITQTATNANNTTQTNGYVQVTGGAATTSVTVHSAAPSTPTLGNPGVTPSTVYVYDINAGAAATGKITTVNIDSYSAINIQDNALSNLTVAHGDSSGAIIIQNGGATSPTTTLNLTLNAVPNGALTDNGVYTTLNVTMGASASTLGSINLAALTSLNVAGASGLTLTSTTGATNLHTVTVTGAASLNATLGAGADTISLGAGASTINTGAGADVVNITAANAASNSVYSTLTVSAGDKVGITALGGAAAFTGAMGAAVTGTTFQSYLNAAAAGDGHTTSHWSYFQFFSDTYIVVDNSAASTFQAGTDIVVKLVGAFTENGATITGGVLTVQ
jgi:S-layer protein